MLRNSGMSPMPSGNSRQTSSATPGRMVGLIMPTTPRQLENAMVKPRCSVSCKREWRMGIGNLQLFAIRHSPFALLSPIDRRRLGEEAPQDVVDQRVVLLLKA